MNSIIVAIAARYLKPILIGVSIFVLLRGHHHPGGGFIAALLAATGIAFKWVSSDSSYDKARDRCIRFIALGMLICVVATGVGPLYGKAVLKGLHADLDLVILRVELGTPLLFDAGIYCLITAAVVLILISIIKEIEWK